MDKQNINYIYDVASKRIKMFRKYRKLTQEQLSENSTFSCGFIANIESEKNGANIFFGSVVLSIVKVRYTNRIIC